MSDLDVSLRLKLVNQLSRPAEEAERDLKELEEAAKRLGKTKGGDQLAADLAKIEQKAGGAKTSLADIDRTARQLGKGGSGLDSLAKDADKVVQALGGIERKAETTATAVKGIGTAGDTIKQKFDWMDRDPSLDALKRKADSAATAVKQIGTAADAAEGKLKQLDNADRVYGPRAQNGRVPPPGSPERRRIGGDLTEGLVDRAGLDAIVPMGVGLAYGAGAAFGGGAIYTGQAYTRFAGNDRETKYIFMAAGVPEEKIDGYRRQVRDVARDTRMPYAKVQEGLAELQKSGLPIDEVMAMLPAVSNTALASNAEPADVARTVFAIRDMMKVAPERMPLALDMVVAGGNLGQFEVPDMATYLPTVLAYASQAGLSDLGGLAKVIAQLQAARADTGDSSTAATNLQNVYAKMRSQETEKNFKDYGVDLPAEFKAGRAAGKDDAQILYEAAMKASNNGDIDVLARLFPDQQAFIGLQSMVSRQAKIKADEAALATDAPGTVERQRLRVANDAQSSIDAIGNATDRFTVAIGRIADQLGVSKALDFMAGRLDASSDDPGKTLQTIGSFTGPTQFSFDFFQRLLGNAYLSRPFVVPTGDWRAPAYEPARTKSGVSDVRPMPSGPVVGAITGRVESELSEDMSGAAEASMDGYNSELRAQGDKAVVTVQSVVQQLKAMLSFTASPVISPVVNAPSGGATTPAPARDRLSSAEPVGGSQVKLTQYITSPDARLAARSAVREQNRSIRLAQANALHDLGSRV